MWKMPFFDLPPLICTHSSPCEDANLRCALLPSVQKVEPSAIFDPSTLSRSLAEHSPRFDTSATEFPFLSTAQGTHTKSSDRPLDMPSPPRFLAGRPMSKSLDFWWLPLNESGKYVSSDSVIPLNVTPSLMLRKTSRILCRHANDVLAAMHIPQLPCG